MIIKIAIICLTMLGLAVISPAKSGSLQTDIISTSKGDVEITFIGHASLMFKFQDKVVQIDPVSSEGDYSKLPKADLILITHHHGDHFDVNTINQIRQKKTQIICTETCSKELKNSVPVKNGDTISVKGIKIEAVPAYNLVHKRDNGQSYHPKGIGNGYVLTFGDTRVYIAGDTENFPEMKYIKDIDIAFLPMNLPYTMTPEMVAAAVNVINPKILYPYHYGDTDVQQLLEILKNKKDCEIRIRKLE